MKKTIGLVALLISSAAVMVQPALARGQEDFARKEVQYYTPARRDMHPDYRNDYRRDRHDYRRMDTYARRDYDRR